MTRTLSGLVKRLAAATVLAVSAVAAVAALATPPGTSGSIAFRRYADAAQTSGAVFTMNPDGSGVRQVSHPPARTIDDNPDWSPDGGRLVFCRHTADVPNCTLMLVHADGSGLRRLTRAGQPPKSPDDYDASFAPDGDHITFTRASGRIKHFKKLNADMIEHSAIGIIGADGRGEHEILRLPPYSADVAWPQISPDLKRVVFERVNSPVGHPKNGRAVFVANADGSGVHRVTPWSLHAGDNTDWSPDSSQLLVRANNGNGKESQYYTVRPDGTELTPLTHVAPGTGLLSASYSPDGQQIVFARADAKDGADVWTMNADASNPRPVLALASYDSQPDWGAAGGVARAAATPTYPDSMAILGHSGATGEDSDPAKPHVEVRANSWATGTNPAVNSVYQRILAHNPKIAGHNANLAQAGATVRRLVQQARRLVELKPQPELVLVQIMDNDIVCPAKASDFAAFRHTLISALRIIAQRSPTSRMFLVSQFGSPQTWWKAASPEQRKAFGGTGPCAFIDPGGGFVPKENRRLEHSIHGYEGQLKAACARVPRCSYDNGAFGDAIDRREYISEDLNHFTISGHAAAAAVAWSALERAG